jgi:hypothetical protein
MRPKSKKDVQPVLAEDFSQDVLLLTSVQDVQLKLVSTAAADFICDIICCGIDLTRWLVLLAAGPAGSSRAACTRACCRCICCATALC